MIESFYNQTKDKVQNYFQTDLSYIAKGGFWLVLAQSIGVVSGLISLYFFTQILSKEIFGTYKYILSFISIISILTLPGMNGALTQAMARGFDGGLDKSLFLKLRWSLLSILACILVSGYYFYNDNMVLAGSFFIMALFLPFMNVFYLYRAVLSGKSLFKEASIAESVTRGLSLVVMVGTLFFSQNILVLIFVYFAHYTFIRLAFYLWTKYTVELNNNYDPKTISFGKHLSLMSIIGTVASQFDKILVFHYVGAAGLAIYVVAMSPVDQIRGMVGHLETLAFPKFARQSDIDLKKYLPAKIFRLEMIILPIILVYILAAPFIFRLFFPEYVDGVIYSQLMALVLFFSPRSLITAALGAKMKTKELYFVRIAGPLVKIALLFVFVSSFGLLGAVISVVLAEGALYLMYFGAFKRM